MSTLFRWCIFICSFEVTKACFQNFRSNWIFGLWMFRHRFDIRTMLRVFELNVKNAAFAPLKNISNAKGFLWRTNLLSTKQKPPAVKHDHTTSSGVFWPLSCKRLHLLLLWIISEWERVRNTMQVTFTAGKWSFFHFLWFNILQLFLKHTCEHATFV